MEFKKFKSMAEKAVYFTDNRTISAEINDRVFCASCEKSFYVHNFRVAFIRCECCDEINEVIVCPNYETCGGVIDDWIGIEMLN